jgi:hypothetical protein
LREITLRETQQLKRAPVLMGVGDELPKEVLNDEFFNEGDSVHGVIRRRYLRKKCRVRVLV